MTSLAGPALVPASAPGPHTWEIVRYQQARWALAARCFSKDPRFAREALGYRPSPNGAAAADAEEGHIRNLANSDPPEHTRLRRHLARAVTAGRVRRLRPRIVRAAAGLVGAMAAAGSVDLVRSFIFPLHVTVMCDLLGVPLRDRARFSHLAAGMRTPAASDSIPASCHEAYRRMSILVAELLAAKREQARPTASPDLQPDLLSALVASRTATNRLSEHETRDLAMLLISAGQEPTIDLIANAVVLLLLNPGQLRLFREHSALRTQAVEESLRSGAPVLAAPRIAAEDIEMDGTVIGRGSVIAVMLGCAHRDASQFREPAEFQIARKPNPHLAFGHGVHYCIGAPLARLQASVALTALLTGFSSIALTPAPDELRWSPLRGRRGLVELPVELGPYLAGRRGGAEQSGADR